MRVTCTKRWSEIPFAHRQPVHDGHCKWIHGHNWSIEAEFEASRLDDNGFVIDFGGLTDLRVWMDVHLDHAIVLSEGDPVIAMMDNPEIAKVKVVPDCSCEGLARYILRLFDERVGVMTQGRVRVIRCTVFEDSKNSATVHYDPASLWKA